jgi:hypothetical protein
MVEFDWKNKIRCDQIYSLLDVIKSINSEIIDYDSKNNTIAIDFERRLGKAEDVLHKLYENITRQPKLRSDGGR